MTSLQFQAVTQYMAEAPDAAQHSHLLGGSLHLKKDGGTERVDFSQVEKTLLCINEINTHCAGVTQDRFLLKDFNVCLPLRFRSAAVGTTQMHRKEHTVSHKLTFLSNEPWYLMPQQGYSHDFTKSVVSSLADRVAKGNLLAACSNMPGAGEQTLNMHHVLRKLATVPDMRHMFMKMYLILHDYNLGVTSKCQTRERCSDMEMKVYNKVSDDQRLDLICSHNMVIDQAGMTSEEVGVLLLAGQEYPSVWYAGDNIYTQTHMEADSLAIVSREDTDVMESLAWGSPTRLYSIIVSLACKLGAVEDMKTAFRTMRGKCQMMKDMVVHTKNNVVISDVPLSVSMTNSLGKNHIPSMIPSNIGGYFASTTCLINDLLYGMHYKMDVASLVEVTGGLGISTCTKGVDPRLDNRYAGILRDHGLNHQEPLINKLLTTWQHTSGTPLLWAFGSMLKDYVMSMAHSMRNGTDVPIPQLTALFNYTVCSESAWGAIRNYKPPSRPMMDTKTARETQLHKTASFMWALGLRSQRPRVGANDGSHKDILFSDPETDFMTGTEGSFTIINVSYSVEGEIEPREDETEQSASVLTREDFLHTRCNLVYDYQAGWVNSRLAKIDGTLQQEVARQSFRNLKTSINDNGMRVEPIPVRKPMVARDWNAMHTVFSKEPILRTGASGVPAVPGGYNIVGKPRAYDVITNNNKFTMDDRVSIEEVETRGDGKCGVNAIIQGLKIRGHCRLEDEVNIVQRMQDEAVTDNWQDIADLGKIAGGIQIGIDMYAQDEGGGYMLTRFDNHHESRMPIIWKDGHYSTAIVKKDDRGEEIKEIVMQDSNDLPETLKKIIKT